MFARRNQIGQQRPPSSQKDSKLIPTKLSLLKTVSNPGKSQQKKGNLPQDNQFRTPKSYQSYSSNLNVQIQSQKKSNPAMSISLGYPTNTVSMSKTQNINNIIIRSIPNSNDSKEQNIPNQPAYYQTQIKGSDQNSLNTIQKNTNQPPLIERGIEQLKNNNQYSVDSNHKVDDRKEDATDTILVKNKDTQKVIISTTKGIVGLKNIGNTCFMNSVLQCILNTPNFNDSFIDGSFKKDMNPKNKGMAQEYSQLIQKIRQAQNFTSESTYGLKKAIEKQSNQFAGYEQQDAQELMIHLLEGINQDMNKVQTKPIYKEMNDDLTNKNIQQLSQEWWAYHKSRENSVVQDNFIGQLLNKVTCQTCQTEALAFDTFVDVQLSLSRSLEKLSDMELVRLIDTFLKEEQLDESYCQKCKKLQKSKRQFFMWRLPNILVFTIKRFNFRRFSSDKLQNKIKFPIENLDLDQFIKNSSDPSVNKSQYQLYGVVNHSGNLSGGHYTADCMSPIDKKWYRFNDSNVSEINIQSQGYETQGSSSPYILFYCKKELM